VGGIDAHICFQGGPGGGGVDDNVLECPPSKDLGETPQKRKFWENCLVKYCNFVINMNHSSLGCKYDGRSYVRVFFPYKETFFYV
jgi:hypothetical protein